MPSDLDRAPYVQWSPKSGGTVRVYADAVENEDFDATAVKTSNPVESGSRVTDHVRNEPVSYKCRMFFSDVPVRGDLDPTYHPGVVAPYQLPTLAYPNNTPLLSPGGLTNAVEGAIGAGVAALTGAGPNPPKMAKALQFRDPPGRLQEFLQQLLIERDAKTLFTTKGDKAPVLTNMCLTSIGLHRTADDGDSGALDLEFEELVFTSTETTAAVPLPKEPRGQTKKSGKAGNTEEVTGPQKTGAAALADSLLGG